MPKRGENIRKRKDGRWEGRYVFTPAGESKPKVCSVYAKTYKEIRKKLSDAKQNVSIMAKQKIIDNSLLFTDVASEWLEYAYKEKKYSTYVKYKQIYEKHIADFLRGQKLSDINSELIEVNVILKVNSDYEVETLSESLKKSIYCVINQILSYASIKYRISVNSINKERYKAGRQQIQIFNAEEQQKLLQFLSKDMNLYKLGIVICLYTGLRIGELCALKWSDIDMNNKIIRVTSTVQRLPVLNSCSDDKKTELIETEPKSICSKREIPICDFLYRLLIDFHHTEPYVIGKEKITDPRSYQKRWVSYLRKTGIEYRSFHTLRHTFASNCAACGTDAKALSEMLGHSNVEITLNRYIHPSMKIKHSYLNMLAADLSGQNMGQN